MGRHDAEQHVTTSEIKDREEKTSESVILALSRRCVCLDRWVGIMAVGVSVLGILVVFCWGGVS